jgi:hypothetical protein
MLPRGAKAKEGFPIRIANRLSVESIILVEDQMPPISDCQDMFISAKNISNFSIGLRSPDFEICYAAVDKQSGVMAAIGMSAAAVLIDASEKTGLPKD